jgi:MFS family permease
MTNRQFFILILLGSSISQLGAEIIGPSLPFINQEFGVSSALSSLSISYYNLGMALPLILFGIAADKFNRKIVLIVAAVIGLIGSFVSTIAPNIYILIIGRFIQAIGLSGISGLSITILRDKYSGVEFAKYLSYFSIAFSLTIDIAPFIGGILQTIFSFRVIFLMLLLLNLYLLYLISNYQDLHIQKNTMNTTNSLRHKLNILLHDNYFIVYNSLSAIIYSIFMSYIILATFIIQDTLHKSPLFYSIVVICLSGVFSLGCLINARLVGKININKLIFTGFILSLITGLMLLLTLITPLGLSYFIIAVLPLFIGSAFIFPNVNSLAFATIKEDIALASGINSTIKFLMSFIITSIIGFYSDTPSITLGISIILLSVIAIVLLRKAR